MKKVKRIIRISYGIDVSSDDFAASCGLFYDDMKREVVNIKKFKNSTRGFEKFVAFTKKHQSKVNPDANIESWYVMEASGVYYENLAYYLNEKGLNVHVALANKVKSYIKTLENKSKNDELDSMAIAQYGLEKQLRKWVPASARMKELKELSREMAALKQERCALKNRKHAREKAHQTNTSSLRRIKQGIRFVEKQIKEIEKEIESVVKSDPVLKDKIEKITVLKGIGLQTAALVVAETNGFEGIKNKRQLTSYVGLDVRENQSGKKTGKASISKHGNKHIRKGLYMPALCCKKHDKKMKDLYERVCERHGYKNKKIAIVAVMRKIIHIIYALWKNQTVYDPNFVLAKAS